MLTLMAVYEDELKKPIRNLVNGQLARSLLIQVCRSILEPCHVAV
jgi:hypothetical protein